MTVESKDIITKVIGDQWTFRYRWEREDTPVDMTGFTVELKLKNPEGTTVTHPGTVTDPAGGRFEFVIDEAATELFAVGSYKAFIRVTSPDDDPYTIIIEKIRAIG